MLTKATSFERSRVLWGDSFADDDPSHLMMQAKWDIVVPDELFRFMPNLQGSDKDRWPEPIEWAFRTCLDTQPPCKAVDVVDPAMGAEAAAMINALLNAKGEVQVVPFDDKRALLLAFVSGVHPAYIWPEALLAHDRYATFTWLGRAARHRRALMPLEVAIYLLEVLAIEDGSVESVDPMLIAYVKPYAQFLALRAAATRRTKREAVVFEHPRRTGLLARRWWPL